MTKKINWKKILQAGALVTEAGSRGSSGGIASALQQTEIDLSGQNPFNEQKTSDAAGQKAKRTGRYSTDSKGRDYDDPYYGS